MPYLLITSFYQSLFRINSVEADDVASLGGLGALLSQREKSNAKKFAKMIIVDPYSTAKEEFGHHPVVNSNLQYLPIIYPPFAKFNVWTLALTSIE